jgi:hypothetical protein
MTYPIIHSTDKMISLLRDFGANNVYTKPDFETADKIIAATISIMETRKFEAFVEDWYGLRHFRELYEADMSLMYLNEELITEYLASPYAGEYSEKAIRDEVAFVKKNIAKAA